MRYNAGLAVSRGLPYAAGIEALTLAPARIFGVADQMGSIAPSKAADIVIWDGDPLESLPQPTAIFIAGKKQPQPYPATELGTRHARGRATPGTQAGRSARLAADVVVS